jgi:uncharacterized protein with PQ loop repeat
MVDMTLIDWIGWTGNFLLATCAVPLLWETIKTKGKNVPMAFMWYWLTGEVLAIWFAIHKGQEIPIIANYFANVVLILVIVYLALRGKK